MQIQRLRPMHWLHPTAVLLASLYESLQTSTYQPRRLMKLLQQHMGMIHLVGPVPAQMGCQKMPPITPYILSEQVLIWLLLPYQSHACVQGSPDLNTAPRHAFSHTMLYIELIA